MLRSNARKQRWRNFQLRAGAVYNITPAAAEDDADAVVAATNEDKGAAEDLKHT